MGNTEIKKEMSFSEVAKILGVSNSKFLKFLRTKRIVFRKGKLNIPRNEYVDSGWFTVEQRLISPNFKATIVRLTKKGLIEVQNLIIPSYETKSKKKRNYKKWLRKIN